MNKFNEYKIDTSDKNKKLVTDYLENVKDYINNNSLDFDLYNDIEERVFEKLGEDKSLNQLKVKQILNEIGQVEDIFELEESKANSDVFVFARNMKNTGIKAMQKIFETGVNIGNVIIFIKTIFINLFHFTKKVIIKIYNFLIISVIFLYKNFSKLLGIAMNIGKKIFHMIGSFVGYIIVFISMLMLFFIPLLYNGIELGNINYTNIIPQELIVSYLFFVLSLFILGVFFISKKRLLLHFIGFGVSFVLILSFGFLSSTQIYNNHSYRGEMSQKYIIESKNDIVKLDYNSIDLYGDLYVNKELFNEYDIEFKKSETQNFQVGIDTIIHTKDLSSLEKIKSNLSNINISEEDGLINVSLENDNFFNSKFDFIPVLRIITIYIPENKVLEVEQKYRYYHYNRLLRNCDSRIIGTLGDNIVCLEKIEPSEK